MNNKKKNIIQDLNDKILDARLNRSNEEYKKILKKIITSHADLITDLNEIVNEYELYYIKYEPLINRSEKTSEIKKHIKNYLDNKLVFGYGFFSQRNNRALYIGITYKGLERISQHLDGYSSVDRRFPLYWIDYIRIWYDDRISKHIINLLHLRENTKNNIDKDKYQEQINECMSRLESFIYQKFKPFFNSPIEQKQNSPNIQRIFKEACKKAKENIIPLKNKNFKKVLRKLSF